MALIMVNIEVKTGKVDRADIAAISRALGGDGTWQHTDPQETESDLFDIEISDKIAKRLDRVGYFDKNIDIRGRRYVVSAETA